MDGKRMELTGSISLLIPGELYFYIIQIKVFYMSFRFSMANSIKTIKYCFISLLLFQTM